MSADTKLKIARLLDEVGIYEIEAGGELCPTVSVSEGIQNLGARVQIFRPDGTRLARLGTSLPGSGPGEFVAPHALAVDSRGDLYVGEVSWQIRGRRLTPPRELRSLQKFVRVQ
jgi:hypothetical protein